MLLFKLHILTTQVVQIILSNTNFLRFFSMSRNGLHQLPLDRGYQVISGEMLTSLTVASIIQQVKSINSPFCVLL